MSIAARDEPGHRYQGEAVLEAILNKARARLLQSAWISIQQEEYSVCV
jgi:hypothetical protein